MIAGSMKQMRIRPIQSIAVMAAFAPEATSLTQPVYTPIWPTRPHVPMPDETAGPFICSLNRQVASGPVTAEATIGGIQMRGLRTMLPICSILVPMPCEISPPQRFSRKLMTAKPTICAQQPATAAPPARPVSVSAAQIAALEMGSVSAMPMTTDTTTPMTKGCCSVAHMMSLPSEDAARPMAGARSAESATPTKIVKSGVTSRSTFVSFEIALPHSAATMAMISTASGPPAPPRPLAALPTVASENSTSGGQCSA